jgi:putative transposase
VRLPAHFPNLTPHIEQFMRTINDECLKRIIFFGQSSLEHAGGEILIHDHPERNHQGLENRLIDRGEVAELGTGKIECREHLGGMLRYYYREAA